MNYQHLKWVLARYADEETRSRSVWMGDRLWARCVNAGKLLSGDPRRGAGTFLTAIALKELGPDAEVLEAEIDALQVRIEEIDNLKTMRAAEIAVARVEQAALDKAFVDDVRIRRRIGAPQNLNRAWLRMYPEILAQYRLTEARALELLVEARR